MPVPSTPRTTTTAPALPASSVDQPVTPSTAQALQFQWTHATGVPTEAEVKRRLAHAPGGAVGALPTIPQQDDGTKADEDEDADADNAENDHDDQDEPQGDDDHDHMDTPWQSPEDLPERRLMVQRIIALTEKRGGADRLADARRRDRRGVQISSAIRANASALAKRIELSLYSRAGSLDEYRNTATLRRRLQSLVSLSFHEAAAAKSDAQVVPVRRRRAAKRQRPSTACPSNKRPRHGPMASSTVSGLDRHHSGRVLGGLSEDCLRVVFGFLPGREVLPLRALNRFAVDFLPTCVTTLEVDVSRLIEHFTRDQAYRLFRSMPGLRKLVVYKSTDPCAEPTSTEQKLALHAWGCAELDVSHDNAGELAVLHLANAIVAGACRRLERLQLVSIFTNTTRRNGLRALCAALNQCSELQDLLLGGNSITDLGTTELARLLQSGAVPKLARLDLRRNYIGESGLQRIMTALVHVPCPELTYLCMGGNLITDKCVEPLTAVLARGACPQMRFLGLEDNFLSPEGVQAIIQAAVHGGMVPKLHRVASDGTAAD